MNNLQRLEMEAKGMDFSQNELIVYLQENGLSPHEDYNATSADSKKAIYQTALSVLESVANNPSLMKNIRLDDRTVTSQKHIRGAFFGHTKRRSEDLPINL